MSRIAATFEGLKAQRRKALIPFVTAGDPHPSATVSLMLAMAEAGADGHRAGRAVLRTRWPMAPSSSGPASGRW